MNIYCLATLFSFIQNAIAYVEIKGEVTFHLYPIRQSFRNVKDNKRVIEKAILHKEERASLITAAVRNTTDKVSTNTTFIRDDCLYQIPDDKQIDLLLSDMMNQLTKIFTRASDFMTRRQMRRNVKRYKIIRQKFDSSFFEDAYNLMSKEFKQSINATQAVSKLRNRDPCRHQEEVKNIWTGLLEQSKAILKRAAVRCVSDFLRVRNRADDSRAKEKLAQLLLREMREVRSNQIKVLCDNFKLCYKDLLS